MMIEAIVDAKYYWDNRYYENLPCGWKICGVSDITNLRTGATFDKANVLLSSKNEGIRVLRGGNISTYKIDFRVDDIFIPTAIVNPSIYVQQYDIITPAVTSLENIGKMARVHTKPTSNYTVGGFVYLLTPLFYNNTFSKFLLYQFTSTWFIRQLQTIAKKSGAAFYNINKTKFNGLPVFIPPLEEQARIVNRIEELFTQIDIIEQNQADIDVLYDEFRKRTLTLAIQGKLVPQDPNDEPANVLLERISAEKKAKLGKKYVDSYIYKGDDNCYYEHIAGRAQDELVEVPFDIPYGWSWCRLAIFAQVLGGKRIPAGRQLTNENTGHYYIKVSDMKENTVCLDKLQFVPTDIYPTISRYIINKEDVYITVAGTIGRVGTIPNELDGANLTENADRIVIDEIDQHWLVKCLLSDVIQEQIKEATTKVGQPKLAIARIEKFLIPLPPLAEQKRIVAKINEIFAML